MNRKFKVQLFGSIALCAAAVISTAFYSVGGAVVLLVIFCAIAWTSLFG